MSVFFLEERHSKSDFQILTLKRQIKTVNSERKTKHYRSS